MVRISFGWELEEANEIGRVTSRTELSLSGTCLVKRAFEASLGDLFIDVDRFKPDNREF